MSKLFKYLKKYSLQILVIFIFLILQAYCELTMPGYTSDIVNVGIQKSGLESPVPEAIRESELNKLLLFLDGSEEALVLDAYTLVTSPEDIPDDRELIDESMLDNAGEGIYILNNEDDKDTLRDILQVPMMLTYSLSNDSEDMQTMKEQLLENFPQELLQMAAVDEDENIDIFALFSMLPEAQMKMMLNEIKTAMTDMPETLTEQVAFAFTVDEYETIGINLESIQNRYILVAGAKMIGLALLAAIVSIAVAYMASRIAASLSQELRSKVFHKVMAFSNAEYNQFSTASLITRSTNDIQQVQMLVVMMLRMLLYSPVLAIGGIFKVLSTNVDMGWVLAVGVGVILLVVLLLFTTVMPKFKLMQKLVDKINLVTREILTGLPVIRAFSTEEHEKKRFDIANTNLKKNQLFVNRVMSCMMPMMMLIMNLVTVLIVWVAAGYIDGGTMQVGDLMAFIQYAMMIIMSFLMLSMVSIMLPRASVSAGRIDEILMTELSINDVKNPESFVKNQKGVVEFKNVSFKYPGADEDVLIDISFVAKPGETTAFIGSTGSGKSTLVNLIPRFFDVTEGCVLVDGCDVRKVSSEALRDRIGYIPQKGILFSGTIESNIKYSDENISQEAMERAARIAQAKSFIEEKSDKYESEIAQGGTNISGGQKQRLSIARAIAKNPEIYIFDDSFSALDYKTDVALRKALKEETADSTVMIVAQRISTILHAEQIVVLDDGKVVGKGTHSELLDSCDVYRQIATSQLSEEELKTKKEDL